MFVNYFFQYLDKVIDDSLPSNVPLFTIVVNTLLVACVNQLPVAGLACDYYHAIGIMLSVACILPDTPPVVEITY
jgi:hypothetical protein